MEKTPLAALMVDLSIAEIFAALTEELTRRDTLAVGFVWPSETDEIVTALVSGPESLREREPIEALEILMTAAIIFLHKNVGSVERLDVSGAGQA